MHLNKGLIILIIVSITMGILLPLHETQALGITDIPGLAKKAWDFVYNTITFRNFLGFLVTTVGSLLAGAIDATTTFARPLQIENIWEIVRNFINLFFILALVIMSFGTIFNIKGYGARDLFVGFLIAALLVNFSFVIGAYIIDTSNALADIMLNTISEGLGGDPDNPGGSIQDLFMKGFSIKQLFGPAVSNPLDGLGAGTAIGIASDILLTALFTILAILAMIVVFFFLIIRIPVLWILLIISPVAWFGLALPSLRRFWSGWWDHFLGWCFWVPSYFFILALLAIIMGTKPAAEVTWTQIFNSHNGTNGVDTGLASFSQVTGLNEILYFLVTLIFMLGGVWVSFKASKLFKGSVGTGVDYAMNAVGMLGEVVGVTPRIEGTQAGIKSRFQNIVDRGGAALPKSLQGGRLDRLLGEGKYGRARTVAEAAQRAGSFFGGETMTHEEQHTLEESIKTERERLVNANPGLEKDPALMAQLYYEAQRGGRTTETLALAQLRAKNGALDNDPLQEINNTWNALGGMHSSAGQEYWKSVRELVDKDTTQKLFDSSHGIDKLAISQLRAEKGWLNTDVPVSDPLSAANEITTAIRELGGIQNEAAKKYLDASKNFVNQDTISELYAKLGGRDKLAIAEIRADKGWAAEGAPGQKEILDTVRAYGENSKEANDYLNKHEKMSFGKVFADTKKQLDFANGSGVDSIKKKLYFNLARKQKLVDEKDLVEVLKLHEKDSKETVDQVKELIKQNIRNSAKTAKQRRSRLENASDDSLKKLIADIIIDANEVKDYNTYVNILKAYGKGDMVAGRAEPKVLEMEAKLRAENSLVSADLNFEVSNDHIKRKKDYRQAITRMTPRDLIDASDSYYKNNEDYEEALFEEILRKESQRKSQYNRSSVDGSITGIYPGAGRDLLISLYNSADEDQLPLIERVLQRAKNLQDDPLLLKNFTVIQ